MAVPVQKMREIVFQLLYSYDSGPAVEGDMIPLLMKELAVTRKTVASAQERVRFIQAVFEELDTMIRSTSVSYAFERIQSVERNILRLGLYELFFDDDIPPKVAISEAMRLARKFASPESARYVNAILDALYQASLGNEVEVKDLLAAAKDMEESEKIALQASLERPHTEDSVDEAKDS